MMITKPRLQCNIDDIFAEYGLPGTANDTFRCRCPIHGGNGNSFVYYGDIQRWKCFSHHCEEEYGSGLSGLVYALTGTKRQKRSWTFDPHQQTNNEIVFTNTPNNIPYVVNPYIPYLIHRGFFSQTVKHFEAFVSANKQHQLYDRVVLPVRDHNGQVVGFSGRSQDQHSALKWCHYEFKSGQVIYNFHNIKDAETIVLVEGPFDVWRAWEAGITFCGGLFGTNISRHQIHLINTSPIKNVILCLDPDKAGGHATIKKGGLFDKLSETKNVYSIRHVLQNDLGDMTVKDIRKHVCPEIQRIMNEA